MKIHVYARKGDIEGVARELSNGTPVDAVEGSDLQTPLMCAVASPEASIDLVRLLIARGADVNAVGNYPRGSDLRQTVLGFAVRGGDLDKIRLLLDAGADINYRSQYGYDVLIDAACRWAVVSDEKLISMTKLLIERGVPLNGVSDYSESALSVASNNGRFDVVQLVLQAGADPGPLEWTELMHALALGSLRDVERCLEEDADLSARDFWSRTPWLLSLQTGDLDKAKRLLASGADRTDVGRCGKTPMAYAIEMGYVHTLSWLLEEGFDIEATDEFGTTPLMVAAEHGAAECVGLLLDAGANRNARTHTSETTEKMLLEMGVNLDASDHIGEKAIKKATSLEVIRMLVDAGEDLNDIDDSMRALLTGVEYEGELQASREAYAADKNPRFGSANPEVMEIEFWKAMVRSGARAWTARAAFGDTESLHDGPVWCFHRFGKSITELPDGRFIEIGGEHEDFYDPDFCIYNDVIVHYGGGKFDILGYPKHVFPPTDFHSATLVGNSIYIIGCLGYQGERLYGETPVYRLDCSTYAIEKIETTGDRPGWISRHKAHLEVESGIRLSGGKICALIDGKEEYNDNPDSYTLALADMSWRRA